jgi:hypothetical protein
LAEPCHDLASSFQNRYGVGLPRSFEVSSDLIEGCHLGGSGSTLVLRNDESVVLHDLPDGVGSHLVLVDITLPESIDLPL